MAKRPTIKDVAEYVGLHYSTVSRALRGDTRIAEESRLRIQEAAKQLGYVRDPVLDSLITYRSGKRPSKGNIQSFAYIAEPLKENSPLNSVAGLIHKAIVQRATELGFDFHHYSVDAAADSIRNLGVELVSDQVRCGVTNLFQGSLAPFVNEFGLGCNVAIGGNHGLDLPFVSSDSQGGVKLAIENLCLLGYQRLGMALNSDTSICSSESFVAQYLYEARYGRQRACLLPLFVDEGAEIAQFHAWLSAYEPDCLLLQDGSLLRELESTQFPPDSVVLDLDRCNSESGFTGLRHDYTQIAAQAVDQAVELFQRRHFTSYQQVRCSLLAAKWEVGSSALGRRAHTRHEG